METFTTTTQEGLNAVLINKINNRIKSGSLSASEALKRLDEEGKLAADYVAPIGHKNAERMVTFNSNGHVHMNFKDRNYRINKHAIVQIAERMGIPSGYLQNLAIGEEWQRALCSQIMNEHSSWTDRERVLIRTVGDEVRGVLSDHYRRLNSIDIIKAYIEEAYNNGGQIADGLMTDTRIYIETLMPQPFTIPTEKNGDVVIAFGSRLASSDYGAGALELRTFFMQGACLNGAVTESVMRQIHLGGRLPDNLMISEQTYTLDTQTQASAIRDLTKGIYSPENIKRHAALIQGASAMTINVDNEIKALNKTGKILKNEAADISNILMANNPDDGVQGEGTLWKFVQGITAHARNTDQDRARKLQELAGELMTRVK